MLILLNLGFMTKGLQQHLLLKTYSISYTKDVIIFYINIKICINVWYMTYF